MATQSASDFEAMGPNARVVIVGAGHAGGSLAAMLRQAGHCGVIALVGEEPIVPYHRPPLSKAYLKGETDAEALKLRPDSFYDDNDITMHLGTRVDSIDPQARRVTFRGGGGLGYDVLVLATGARPRELLVPGHELKGIHQLRTAADAESLKSRIVPGRHVAIVGGGYVGLEVAASALALGATVTVIEREPRLLARVASEPLSNFFFDYHTARGVEILLDAQVAGFRSVDSGYVDGILLSDGRIVACDAAVVGVGAVCCDELASAAGLTCDNGIVVDSSARTSNPQIFAMGDATRRPLGIYGGRMTRLESVPSAMEQAKQATHAILGKPVPLPEVPWFWSDQYDLKLQIAGLPFDCDSIVVRGNSALAKFAVFHLRGDMVMAVEAVNSPSEFAAGRQMILKSVRVDAQALGNTANSMKDIAAGTARGEQ